MPNPTEIAGQYRALAPFWMRASDVSVPDAGTMLAPLSRDSLVMAALGETPFRLSLGAALSLVLLTCHFDATRAQMGSGPRQPPQRPDRVG